MNTSATISKHLTIGIPVRVDSIERKANLLAVIHFLTALQCRIIVLEADAQPHISDIGSDSKVVYQFVEDIKPVFHRTHYINMLLQMSQTEFVAIWDTDVLVDYGQIIDALQLVQQGATISYPYDGRVIMLSEQLSTQARHSLDFGYLRHLRMRPFPGRKLCGGAYIVHKQRYLQCGGENERFTGWGLEDAERRERVIILGHKACHIPYGELYHLYHLRFNSNYFTEDYARRQREEFIKICCMSPNELKLYISK